MQPEKPLKPLKDPNKPGRRGKLTKEQRQDILNKLRAGEKPGPLSNEYGVSRQAICQLRDHHLNPESAHRKRILRSRLLPDEHKNVIHLIRTTVPKDHGVENEGHGHPDFWNTERLVALTRKLYNKKMYAYAAREAIQEARPDPRFDPDAKPQPPGPPDVRDLSPEFASDPDFVKYYLSPISKQIRQKEYEWALREWEERQVRIAKGQAPMPKPKRGRPRKNPEPEEIAEDDPHLDLYDGLTPLPGADKLMAPPAPGQRVGKHAKSKGAPFTKAKRKKKKR